MTTNRVRRRGLWPWIVAALVLALVGWALSGVLLGGGDDVQVQEATPEAG
jgi:hypothetical protein